MSIKLTEKQISKIKTQAREAFPNEAVWGITSKGIAVQLENIHSNPIEHFSINEKQFYTKDYIALVHSHTVLRGRQTDHTNFVDPRSPSECDMATQDQMQLPWGILALDEDTVMDIIWFPDLDSDILGQEYISGVHDCYTLIQKYYWQTYGVVLTTQPHGAVWWQTDSKLYVDNYTRGGFYPIKESELSVGDMILISITGDTPTHSALYMGGDVIWHHMANRLSHEDSYARWRKKMVYHLSHKKSN